MKKNSKLQSIVTITYAAVFMLFLVFACYMSFAEHNAIYQARAIDQYEILEEYSETTVEDATAPLGIRKEYRWTLSNISTTKDCLGFYLIHHYAQVYIDGALVYSLMPNDNNRIGASPSSNWVFIPLDQTDNGRDIQVIVTPVYKSVLNRGIAFMLGDRSEMILTRLKEDMPQMILSVLCIFLGIVIMIIQPVLVLLKKSTSWGMFYLGNLLLLIGVWRMTDTRFSSIFFSKNPMVLGYVTISALFLAAAPLLLFLKDGFAGRKKTALLLSALAVCFTALIALICQVFQIAELRETLFLCHIMVLVSMAVILLVLFLHVDQKAGKTDLRGMVLLLSAGALADLLFFYRANTSSGIIFTTFALLVYTVVRFFTEILHINQKVYIDTQTGLLNRTRWIDLMDQPEPISETTGVMMLDLNRLKYINDTMGHEMGDKMILGFANILRETLPANCQIFRWGGDEFTVLISGADHDVMNRCISQITAAADAHNTSGERPEIHFAVGYALSTDYPSLSREELMKKADEKMYHNKSDWYRQHVSGTHL